MTIYKRLPILMFLLLLGSLWNSANGEVIGDSIVAIYNNWMVGDTIKYTTYSSRTKIEKTDTIDEGQSYITFEINLSELLPNGDMIFETRTQIPEIGELGRQEVLRLYFERVLNLLKKPQEFVTDSMGVVKDFRNFDYFLSEMDSCKSILRSWVDTLDMPEVPKAKLISGMEKSLDASLSKESLLENVGMFQYYGDVYKIGTSSYNVKLPVPFFDNNEVGATVDFTCEVLEKTEDYEIVSLLTNVTYNSDQLMNLVMTSFLTDQQIHDANLDDPERPYISITQSEEYMIEVLSGTVLQIESEKRAVTPEGSRIDYSLVKMLN